MRMLRLIVCWVLSALSVTLSAQELKATVNLNHSKIEGTDVSVFEDLKTKITEFLNEQHWTDLQFRPNERINSTFNITVNKYSPSENTFECTLLVQAIRPVYNSGYSSSALALTDANFNFSYREYDQLNFRIDQIDNDLTALLAYYAYLIIGIDLDTMSPKGGTQVLQQAQQIVTNAANLQLSARGWRTFSDTRNRSAIITDYLDGSMEPLRQLMYKYHRQGLDIMADNADRGRAVISECFELLKQAHENKRLSYLPQLFTDFKRDEIVNIFRGKVADKERDGIIEILKDINASQSSHWNRIREAIES